MNELAERCQAIASSGTSRAVPGDDAIGIVDAVAAKTRRYGNKPASSSLLPIREIGVPKKKPVGTRG